MGRKIYSDPIYQKYILNKNGDGIKIIINQFDK
jgi:hypothetical protein